MERQTARLIYRPIAQRVYILLRRKLTFVLLPNRKRVWYNKFVCIYRSLFRLTMKPAG